MLELLQNLNTCTDVCNIPFLLCQFFFSPEISLLKLDVQQFCSSSEGLYTNYLIADFWGSLKMITVLRREVGGATPNGNQCDSSFMFPLYFTVHT